MNVSEITLTFTKWEVIPYLVRDLHKYILLLLNDT